MNDCGLLGNEGLKAQLAGAFSKDTPFHCYLITGPEGSGRKPLLRLLAAGLQCERRDPPCLSCPQCRKVLAGTHPDVIVVENREKKYLPVQDLRDMVADVYIKPNEGKRKLYLLPQEVDPSFQPTLLKVIEEPPDYAVFLLVAQRPEAFLPTIRSRCAELKLSPLPQPVLLEALHRRFPEQSREQLSAAAARSGGFLGPAISLAQAGAGLSPKTAEFARAYAAGDRLALLRLMVSLERQKRDALQLLLQEWLTLLGEAMLGRTGAMPVGAEARAIGEARTAKEMQHAIACLRESLTWCGSNVGAGHILGALAAQL